MPLNTDQVKGGVSRRALLAGAGALAAAGALPGKQPKSDPNLRDNRPTGRDDDDAEFLSVDKLRQQYTDYLMSKTLEIEEQKEARRYYHGAQWSAEAVRIMRERRQPVVTYNRVYRKIAGIMGLIERVRQDPKAFPTKPKNEAGAEVATATIRAVLDGNDWKTKEAECIRHCCIDAISGVELKLIEGDQGDPDIGVEQVYGDDYFYDPRSNKPDFSDAQFEGLGKWIDVAVAVELFPDQEDLIRNLIENGSDLTPFADREFKWVITSEKRIRLVEHWYRHKGRWCWAFYVASTLIDEGQSPFRDARGKSISRFIMMSAAVDHDGDRYGFVRNLRGPQDEMNQRRSKALHISNSRRLMMEKGALDDVEIARREWARPDGVIEYNKGFEIKPDDTTQELAAQTQWYADAKEEIEGFANVNLALAGGQGTLNNLSGRAINLLQQPGLAELGPFIIVIRGWKLRVYRAVFTMAQQYWTAERWIRVTDDQDIVKFLQINGTDLDEYGRPVLVNALGALDVDIIPDEGPDAVSMMQDTHDVLKNQPPGTVPLPALIETMPIQGSEKKKLLGLLAPPPPDPTDAQTKQLTVAVLAAEVKNLMAKVGQLEADTIAKRAKALNDVAAAAEHASKAHLNSAQVLGAGFEFAPIEAAEGHQLGPQPPPDVGGPPMGAPPAPPAPPMQPPMPPPMAR